jgi:hypothetical protein
LDRDEAGTLAGPAKREDKVVLRRLMPQSRGESWIVLAAQPGMHSAGDD